eukprot:TRINITY_DN33767_c0_g1_i1.p1 TRINITY_DN33767_c0_g1~~TRINITY_DN33767_c0_g1_i1.p1  ORF type:complete len:209 (-),score=23.12 TRINITY_DN33767_c0_g1_i1:24-650(-)
MVKPSTAAFDSTAPLRGRFAMNYVTTYNDHYHLAQKSACQAAATFSGTGIPGLEKPARGAFMVAAEEPSQGAILSLGSAGAAIASPRKLVTPCTAATSTWRDVSARGDDERFTSPLPADAPPGGMQRLPGGRKFPGGGRRKFISTRSGPPLGVPTTFSADEHRKDYASGRHSPRSRHRPNPFMPLQRAEMILREPVVLGQLPGAWGYY